jgi:D-threo-aldose 1-dehydrogenase
VSAATDERWRRPLGGTGITVSAVCAGGAPLGSMPENFGYEVAESDAIELVEAILNSPIRFLDTSNGYSNGRSEERIGKGIAAYGGLPNDFIVATKVDAKNKDYSGSRVRASVRESKERLGLDTLPLVYLHDPEFHDFASMTAPGGAIETLFALRDEGEIGHVGLAGGDVHEMSRYLAQAPFEVVLVHNRWTLVDHSAGELIDQARENGAAVINAAIYGGGILANPRGGSTTYGYRDAAPATLAAIAALADLSEQGDTDLATVALCASLRDERITSTIVGFSKKERLVSILAAANTSFPDEFWQQVDDLLPAPENWLDAH